jgi:hypothetical protein
LSAAVVREPLMLDPPLALTGDAVAWFSDPEFTGSLVISRGFADLLRERRFEDLATFNAELTPELLEALVGAIDSVQTFSHQEATELPQGARVIMQSLLDSGPLGIAARARPPAKESTELTSR